MSVARHSKPMCDPLVGLDDDLIEAFAMKYQNGGHFMEMTFEAYLRVAGPPRDRSQITTNWAASESQRRSRSEGHRAEEN